MNAHDRLRVRTLFARAADLPREERGAFLETHCGGDANLRAEVEDLLAYDARFGFADDDGGFLGSLTARAPEGPPTGASSPPRRPEPGLPSHVGRYRILRWRGEGGMGTVYEAEQDNPRRIVALKVVRPGLVSLDLVNRFKHEAQILARLHHPGIAQVYEAGMSEDGRPYFAMEFIRGMPLDEYGRSLDARACLELLAKVCDAVQHAHDKGVVHRDLKPGNILVEESGQPKILDFGVAHITAADLLTTWNQTQTGQLLGTLNYMSPEQLTAHPSGLDGRSDVYTLGVILFELLAHRLPYHLNQLPMHEVARAIEREEPTRLSSIDRRFRGDVDVIVAKTLEKDRARRYASAGALASDIRRHLRGETIQARPVRTAERYWRWARRNPTIAGLGAGLTAVLVLTTLASLFVANRMAQLAQNERKSRAAAQAETYRAVLSEAKALRAGHQPGWRDEALGDLARLAIMPMPGRDLSELRSEAAATLGTPDVRLAARVELPSEDLGSFAFDPDGRTLLTAGSQTGLEFWDVPGHRHLSSVEGLAVGESWFDKAVYLPDGQGLAVGTRDRGVVFTGTRGIPTTRAPITRGSSRPTKLAISADGRRIAVAWTDGIGITVHDTARGTLLDSFKDSPFALHPDGRWLARLEGSDIVLRPIASDEPPIVLGHHGGAQALAFSPDGSLLAGAFNDHTTVLWDVAKREQFGILRGHRERVLDVAFSPDGEWIATASLDYTARIWETRTGQIVSILPSSEAVRGVQWSPTGDYLATRTSSPREVFIHLVTGRHRVQRWLAGHRVELRCVAARPCVERFATSGYTELISWDLSLSRPSRVAMEPNPGAVTSLAYSPDGALLATASWPIGGSAPREVTIRDGDTGKVRGRISVPGIVWALAFDPTGGQLACGDNSGNVVVWDLATNRPVQRFATGSEVRSIVFLDHPRRLVTHGRDAVFLFNLESGERERKVELAGGAIGRLVVDRARSRLVVGFQSGAIGSLSLLDLTTGPRLEGAHEGNVECLALSPDGRLLATGGADHRVVLRDAMSFETLLDFPPWVGTPRDLTFDFKGRHLIIVGTNCDVDLWDLGALYDGLTSIGLAWDRPAPADVPELGLAPAGEHIRPAVPIIRRPDTADPAEFERARSRLRSGLAAFESDLWAEATRDLRQAREQLLTLIQAAPGHGLLASELGSTLVSLGSALRNEHRLAEALVTLQEARQLLEAIRQPSFQDRYNLARVYANLTAVVEPGSTPPSSTEREDMTDRAMESFRQSLAAGMTDFALIDRDHDLDPLRERPDFRALILDRGFPRDPFAGP
jgi:eukaryotic-like serine/threonine-protein kinase